MADQSDKPRVRKLHVETSFKEDGTNLSFFNGETSKNEDQERSVKRIKVLPEPDLDYEWHEFPLIDCLPVEIFQLILQKLQYDDLLACRVVSKRWLEALDDAEVIWKELFRRVRGCLPVKVVLPPQFPHWRNYYPTFIFENKLRALGIHLMEQALLTCAYEWQTVSFNLVEVETEGTNGEKVTSLEPKYMSVTLPVDNSSRFHPIDSTDFNHAIKILGVQHDLRLGIYPTIFTQIRQLLKGRHIKWDAKLFSLQRSNGFNMECPMDMIFLNGVGGSSNSEYPTDEEWGGTGQAYRISLDPRHSFLNVNLLKFVGGPLIQQVRERDTEIRQLLNSKVQFHVDLARNRLVLTSPSPDVRRSFIPFEVIGTYSQPYQTWCWAWSNSSWKKEQYAELSRIKDLSRKEGWPEANLFNRPILDCENCFAFVLAHVCAGRISRKSLVLTHKLSSGPQLFIALFITERVEEQMDA